jgi:rhodanese-related sulfurtransferase/ABC-type phosphate/phosphonate transport system substrate-binding protein
MSHEEVRMSSRLKMMLLSSLLTFAAPALADVSVMVAIEPTSRKDGLMLSRQAVEAGLSKALGQAVAVTASEDLADAMRATRSGGYDVFIGPAQVVASALLRGYELVGSNEVAEQYVLVGRNHLQSSGELKGKRIFLPQQDSIYTYMARGMLNANGLSFKDLGMVQHARYPQAGLTAVSLGVSDSTVVRRSDWDEWHKDNNTTTKMLATSGPVPGGFSVAIRKDLSADTREKVARWFTTSAATAGMKPVSMRAEMAEYKAVAELGLFTPTHLPGATVVTAAQAQKLMAQGAVLIDTRTEKEYKHKRIAQAVFAPYHEKSLKDVAFDASQDDFSALAQIDRNVPTIFSCNGAECWKSYKASRTAIAKGYRQVHWFRGGLPEWDAAGLPVERGEADLAKKP